MYHLTLRFCLSRAGHAMHTQQIVSCDVKPCSVVHFPKFRGNVIYYQGNGDSTYFRIVRRFVVKCIRVAQIQDVRFPARLFFFAVGPNICGSSVWNLLRVALLAPIILEISCRKTLMPIATTARTSYSMYCKSRHDRCSLSS